MYNSITVVGHLGGDPVVKTVNNTSLCKFSVATTERWTDNTGVKREKTDWHNVDVWGKLAEVCGQYLRKGSKVLVEGKQEHNKVEKNGQSSYFACIKARDVRFMDSKAESEGKASAQSTGPVAQQGAQANPSYTEQDVPF